MEEYEIRNQMLILLHVCSFSMKYQLVGILFTHYNTFRAISSPVIVPLDQHESQNSYLQKKFKQQLLKLPQLRFGKRREIFKIIISIFINDVCKIRRVKDNFEHYPEQYSFYVIVLLLDYILFILINSKAYLCFSRATKFTFKFSSQWCFSR